MAIRKKLSKHLLFFLCRLVLLKHHPLIIGVTGSIGKSTTCHFIYQLLKNQLKTVKTEYEFATSLTAPLTIIRAKKPRKTKNIFWFLPFYFFRALWLLLSQNYPQCFVLELRSDVKTGQSMAQLIKALQPQVGVITAVKPVHLVYFKNLKRISQAKKQLVELLSSQGLAVLNYDDRRVRKMAQGIQARVVFYGLAKPAQVRAEKIKLNEKGLGFNLVYQNKSVSINNPWLINQAQLYSLLAGLAVVLFSTKLELNKARQLAGKIRPLKGRANLIKGIKQTLLINDAFNATPASVGSALKSFALVFKQRKRIAVLGDMLQMAHLSKKGHCQVGRLVAQTKPDHLVLVGPLAKLIGQEAISLGYPAKQVFYLENHQAVPDLLKRMIKGKEAILFKASHGVKLYKTIERLRRK